MERLNRSTNVQVRTASRQANRLDSGARETVTEFLSEDRIAVHDQVAMRLQEPVHTVGQVAQDLEHPAFVELLDDACGNVRLQTQLVQDLLDMSRIATGQMRLDMQTLMPVSFIHGAIESLRPSAEARRVRLESALDPNAGPVWGDPVRLQQVVWNLLSNALKFTPTDGQVQIALERKNSEIEIRISDPGVGIRPDLLPHIFERFRQGDSSSTRRHGGLGLGLTS